MSRPYLLCVKLITAIVLSSVILACQTSVKEAADKSERVADSMPDKAELNWEALAAKLIERMDLNAGERVLLVAKPGLFDEMMPLLATKVAEQKGVFLGTLSVTENQPQEWNTDFIERAVAADSLQLSDLLQTVDLGVMMPGPVPSDLPYGILQDILEKGNRRTIHFHWSGAYGINGDALPIDRLMGKFYEDVVLNTDYKALAAHQLEFERTMRGQRIQVTTPAGTDISFEIGDRPVTKQDGNASAARAAKGLNLIDREIEIPSGAIRVAPIEETVNGKVAFPDGKWNDQEVKGLVMTFEQGKLIDYTAESGEESVKAELDQAKGSSGESFREFALGFNPKLAISEANNTWIPYYGYGSGVVRLSLGDNSELGGNVTGGYVRWNFFIDATVKVGEEVWVKDGELIK